MAKGGLKYAYKRVCDGKKAHPSRFRALEQIRKDIARKRYEEGDKHPYNCPLCGKWHVGG